MNKNSRKLALLILGGTLLQFGGCFDVILAGIAGGFGVSIISQLLPLSVQTGAGNLF